MLSLRAFPTHPLNFLCRAVRSRSCRESAAGSLRLRLGSCSTMTSPRPRSRASVRWPASVVPEPARLRQIAVCGIWPGLDGSCSRSRVCCLVTSLVKGE
jgi:hypothetical protein